MDSNEVTADGDGRRQTATADGNGRRQRQTATADGNGRRQSDGNFFFVKTGFSSVAKPSTRKKNSQKTVEKSIERILQV
jgi:hypothetical protein